MWVLARTFSLAISPDHIEVELTVAQRRDHAPAAQVRGIGLVVAPAAKSHQLIQVEVGAALCAFDHVVDVQAPPHTAGLAAPACPSQYPLTNQLPLTHAGSRASDGACAAAARSEEHTSELQSLRHLVC